MHSNRFTLQRVGGEFKDVFEVVSPERIERHVVETWSVSFDELRHHSDLIAFAACEAGLNDSVRFSVAYGELIAIDSDGHQVAVYSTASNRWTRSDS